MTKSYDHDTMTIVMQIISKSRLKPQLLEYLRKVEKEKTSLVVTHEGKPVIKISPFTEDTSDIITSLRGSVISYKDPAKPVGEEDWEALK